MKRRILGFLILFPLLGLASSTSNTNSKHLTEDCSFNFAQFKSPLDKASVKFQSLSPENKNEIKKILTQTAELKTGEKIEFAGGGCAHVGYSYTYSNFTLKTKTPQHQAMKAFQLLEATPVISTDVSKTILVKALRKFLKGGIERKHDGLYELPCDDAFCQLDLSAENQMKISYSFAL